MLIYEYICSSCGAEFDKRSASLTQTSAQNALTNPNNTNKRLSGSARSAPSSPPYSGGSSCGSSAFGEVDNV